MTNTIKILDRIKKLLALAQGKGGSANEVAVAAAEASRLMQLHKLTEADIPTDGAEGSDMVDLPAGADFLDSWRFVLVTCVARSFMCETIGLRSAGRRKVRVVGRREDVEVALEVYRHLAKEIERLTNEYQGDDLDFDRGWGELWDHVFGATFGPVNRHTAYEYMSGDHRPQVDPVRREAYRDGLVAGIATKLKEQKVVFEESGEKAMVVARKSKEEIRGYIATKFTDPNQKIVSAAPQPASLDEVDFARGFMRGQQVVVDRPTSAEAKKEAADSKLETTKKGKMRQFDDYETSTRVCSCNASITWSGLSDDLLEWMKVHSEHVDSKEVEVTTTADGRREG
jgi:hypothetical protein